MVLGDHIRKFSVSSTQHKLLQAGQGRDRVLGHCSARFQSQILATGVLCRLGSRAARQMSEASTPDHPSMVASREGKGGGIRVGVVKYYDYPLDWDLSMGTCVVNGDVLQGGTSVKTCPWMMAFQSLFSGVQKTATKPRLLLSQKTTSIFWASWQMLDRSVRAVGVISPARAKDTDSRG